LWNSSSIIEEVSRTQIKQKIIEEVNLNRTPKKPKIIARYHFDPEKSDKRNLRGLLTSLVTQLRENSERLAESMATLYTKCRNGSDPPTAPTEAELTQLLNHFLAEHQAQFPIYIFIDGVDHCMETDSTDSPRKKVLKFLEDLVRSRHPKLYICITSSQKEGMKTSLDKMAAGASSRQVMLHDQGEQKKDVKTYIDSFVRSHIHWQKLPKKDKDDLINKLSERAGGM
jgi:hypothetical protein